jgi:hypothetical protein
MLHNMPLGREHFGAARAEDGKTMEPVKMFPVCGHEYVPDMMHLITYFRRCTVSKPGPVQLLLQ